MRAYLLLGVAALTLGACKLDRDPGPAADQAQLTAGAPFDLLLAPAYADLPPAQPLPVYYAPQPVAYDYWNDAYDMNQAYYNQPPATSITPARRRWSGVSSNSSKASETR